VSVLGSLFPESSMRGKAPDRAASAVLHVPIIINKYTWERRFFGWIVAIWGSRSIAPAPVRTWRSGDKFKSCALSTCSLIL
jgi:hypothetical protein